jgi:hypothetical protein
MQIKADFTKEQLMGHSDVLFEACHPLEKLKAVAALLYAYPDGPSGMGKATIQSVSDMIEDAAEEIERLIDIANKQWHGDVEKLKSMGL